MVGHVWRDQILGAGVRSLFFTALTTTGQGGRVITIPGIQGVLGLQMFIDHT